MRKMVYKFLDEYVGEGANCSPFTNAFTNALRTWSEKYNEKYNVTSDNGTLILWFIVRADEVKVYRSESLCRKIEGYFGIDPNESWKYIRDWFGNKHDINKVKDLIKFIN